ncbi:YadA-like family protein [Pelistega suis]|uniref:Uncharacterized protein n=1 Tax=Pelistega suis TaxID=1631957 RepID=A0A849P5Z8_9BURK|nr:YadA-like family protein [Pelistega suis]NOL51165.1 hypothetical protein [Pelistega suis]
MNKIFKVIWNHSAQCWVAVSELSKTRGKCSSSTDKRKASAVLAVGAGALISGSAFAAVVTTGTVAIDVAGGTPDGLSVGGLNGGMLIHSNASANNINSSVYFGSELDGIAFANATTFGSNISFNSTITDGNKVNPTLIGSNIVVNGFANTGKTGSPLDASNNTALGSNITVNAWNSTVVGAHASANVRDGTVVGMSAKSMEMSTAIGFGSQALGSESVTIGWNALGTSGSSHVVAIGRMAESLAGSATVLGSTARSANNVTVVVGANTRAMGYGDVAIGHRAVGAGGNATAVGRLAYAAGKQNIALGYQALAGIDNFANGANTTFSARATALLNAKKALALDPTNTTLQTAYDTALANYNNFTLYENATSIGFGAIAAKNNTIAFGTSAVATRENATAFGSLANASSVNATAFGTLAAASRENSIAMGTSANASNINATAIGTLANASTINSIAMGNNATVKGRAGGSIAIGANAIVNDTTNGIAIGNGAQLIRTEGDTSRMSIVIGGDAIIRNTDTSQGRSATVIGGNALAGFLTPSGGSGTTTDDADYATATGLLDSGRLMYRAGITNHQGNVDNGATTITNFLRSNEATAIGADARAIGDQSIAIGAQAVSGHASVAIGGNDFDAIAGYGSTYKDIVGAAMPVSRVPDPVYKKADGSTPDNFYETTYAKSGSVAIGLKTFSNEVMGTALGLAAQVQEGAELGTAIGAGARVGNQTSAAGANMTSTSQKSTKGGVAIAAGSVAEGDYTTAIGTSAKALENNSTAISYKALANNTNATAIGALSQATGVDALAIGSGAIASGKESISIGKGNNVSGSHSGAIGDPSYITGSGSYSFGNNNTITTDNTFVFGSGINRNTDLTTNGTLGTVANSVYLGNESEVTGGASSVSGGVGTLKTLDSNQLNTTGTATTAGAIGSVENATVGNVTYGNFQGAKAIGAVSVGASGMERRIQNVAAGEISSTSTDAINGSQLYYVAEQAAKPLTFEANTNAAGATNDAGLTRKLGETLSIIGAATKVDGIVRDTVAPVTGAYSAKNIQTIVTNDGVQIQMAENPEFASVTAKDANGNVTKLAPTGLTTTDGTNTTTVGPNSITVGDTTAADDKPVVITSGPNGGTISNLTTTIAAPATEVAAADKPTANLTNAATLGDVLNAGWNLKENGTAKDVVTPYDTVNFVNGTGTTVSIATNNNVSEVKVNINTTSVNTTPTDTADASNVTIATNGTVVAPTTEAAKNSFLTAGDVANVINNSGFTVKTDKVGTGESTTEDPLKTAGELINPGDTVTFVAGDNLEVKQEAGKITYKTKENVTFANANVTGNLTVGTGDTATTITSGTDGLKVAKPDGSATKITNVAVGSADTDAVNVSQLKEVQAAAALPLTFEANTNAAGDAGNVGLTRKLGQTLSIIGATTKVDGIARDTVAPVAGTYSAKNIQTIVTNDGVQIQMAENPEFASVTAKDANGNVTKLAPTGLTTTDGTNTTTVGPNSITVGDTTAADDKPVVITSGPNGGTISNLTTTIAAPATEVAAADKPTANLTNAATLGDVLNAGWNLKENGTAKDVVTPYDTVNFVNGTGTTVSIATNNNVSEVKVNINTTSVNTTPTDTADASNVTIATNGTVVAPTTEAAKNSFLTAGDVANVINNSGFTVKTDKVGTGESTTEDPLKTAGELINPGDTVTFVAGDNLEVKQEAGKITYKTKENVTFANANVTGNLTVGTGDTATTITSGTDGLKVAKPDGSATKITNVEAGSADTDAVNVSQLKEVQAAAALPLTFEANTNAAGDAGNVGLTRQLGQTLSIIGATTKVDGIVRDTVAPVTGTYSAKNIQTIVTNDGVQIQMAENPEFASVTAKDGDNVTKLAPTGLTTTDGTNTTTVGPNSITVGDTTAADDKPVVITSGPNGGTISNLTTTIAAPATEVAAADKPTANLTNAATLGDVLNAGWNLQENGTAKDVVTAYDTVNFVNGTGTVVNIITTDNNVSKVQIDVNTSALTQNITTTDGKAGLPTTGTPDGNKLATASDVINAINNSGWNTNSTTATGTATNTLVKPGAAVNFEAGTNMEVVQKVENGNVSYTYQTKENVTFANANVTGNLTVGTGDTATTITSGADGLKVAKPDGSATKITNVANGTVSADSKDAVNGSQLYAAGNATANVLGGTTTVNSTTGAPEGFTFNVTDAAGNTPANLQATNVTGALSNLNTYINQGWIVGNNAGTEVARIAPNEQVNFVDSDTISATVQANDKGGANISFSVKSGSVSGGGNGSTTGSGGFVTGSQVAEAINQSGWSLAADGTAGSELINPSETVTFKAGNNMEVVRDGANITYKTKENVTFTNVNATNVAADTVTVGPVTISKTDGINAGDKKVTGVAAGDISPTSTDAVNGAQIFALTGGQTTNVTNITVKNPDGTETTYNNVVVDENGNPALITYNVDGRGEYITNSVITAVNNMNQQGIKFFHTNNSTNRVTSMDQRTNGEDSQAGGAYATAIGYKAIAQGDSALAMGNSATATGENAIAIGINAQATAKNSISVGNGNIVEGKSSGAFGDPNYVMGTDVNNVAVEGSYAIGNDNVINSSNTFVLGNNVNNSGTVGANGKPVAQGNTVQNSVYLGNNTTATAGNGSQTGSLSNLKTDGTAGSTTTAGSTGTVSSATVNGITYGGFAGATANGVVSVGAAGDERRIQNVAAGEISATSTDAINGSQLYAVASRINNGVDQKLGDIYNKMNANDKDLRAGVAGSNAAASLPQVTLPGKSMVAAAAGTYRGQQALAVGYSRLSDNGKIIIKGQANTNTRGQYGAGVGIGYQW